MRETVVILNDLEQKFTDLSASAASHRIELLTQSNEITRLIKYKSQSKNDLQNIYGKMLDSVDAFDLKKTPISAKLRNIQSASLKLKRELDDFKGPTVTSALAGVHSKLEQLQDRITSLRDQEIQDTRTRQKLTLASGDSKELEETSKIQQLERHQKQLDLVRRRRNSLSRRCNELYKELDYTMQTIEPVNSRTVAGVIEEVPMGPLNMLDVLKTNWTEINRLHDRKFVNNRCRNYITLMAMRNLPVCDYVYDFLVSPSDHAGVLAIANYSFAPGELPSILSFVCMSSSLKEKVYQLSFYNCGVEDSDCRYIAGALLGLPNIHTLTIRNNKLTSIGAMVLFTRIWESHSQLNVSFIYLDGNEIGEEGYTYSYTYSHTYAHSYIFSYLCTYIYAIIHTLICILVHISTRCSIYQPSNTSFIAVENFVNIEQSNI